MNYTLNKTQDQAMQRVSAFGAAKKLTPLLAEEKVPLGIASLTIFITSAITLSAPLVVAHVIDTYIVTRQFSGVIWYAVVLLGMFLVSLGSSYWQMILMGGVGQRMLFRLRNVVFTKLQELPVAFFQQNQAGDLISRINNDTDKLNQFFSQSLMQFINNVFIMIGAGVCVVVIHPRLGGAALAPALVLAIGTRMTSGWIRRKNGQSMQALGQLSSEIQESLSHFKVIVAFNRRDFFREKFERVNAMNYQASVGAGLANNIYTPLYGLLSQLAQLIVLTYGIALIVSGQLTVGLLISFLTYVNGFYTPLRQLAQLWASFQAAMAGWDRISEILNLSSDLSVIPSERVPSHGMLDLHDVTFGYPDGKVVLHGVTMHLQRGKTYALVGPTGGGKTTTASLMARLYDPTSGVILLDGMDIRSYADQERAKKIGFILQDPFLFAGTVMENIFYGNEEYAGRSHDELIRVIESAGLGDILKQFNGMLDAQVSPTGDVMSAGQRQLIAFMRAVLRKPELLILDEATANVDTVTEQLLDRILEALPAHTTKVIIAHRLNTIENADEIFFVNNGEVVPAGSMEHALELLMHGKRVS